MSRLPGLAIVFWLLLWLPGPVRGAEGNTKKIDIAQNPHGDSGLCSSCHTPAVGGRETLRFGGNVSKLCRSCHDGRHAGREVHVTGWKPSEAMAQRIPPKLPLEEGVLTCLSCHDVTPACRGEQEAAISNRYFLRGSQASDPLFFCFQCHAPESYRPFNPHDQLAAGKPKADTCTWCHRGVPDVNAPPDPGGPQALRAKGADLCRNCHTVAADHPVRAHMGSLPPAPMMWYMSAYELKSKMRLPFPRLLEYARTAQRAPRSIPLDEGGRITCYSCHNPHEKGLLPDWDPRSIGAEPKQAVNHRVRSRQGPLCVVCHQK
jgi:hypothetical protein